MICKCPEICQSDVSVPGSCAVPEKISARHSNLGVLSQSKTLPKDTLRADLSLTLTTNGRLSKYVVPTLPIGETQFDQEAYANRFFQKLASQSLHESPTLCWRSQVSGKYHQMIGLRVSDVNYSYGARKALDNVSFEVSEGTFCALLGPNGAGKTTLFNLLTRLFTGRTGKIEIAGHDLGSSPRQALSRLGIVFQQPTLDLDLTVRQNLKYFAALHGLSGAEALRRIDACLDRLDMFARAGEKARNLNGGHRRRAEIARALVPEPTVLLLDEPTAGLDPASRRDITEHVHGLADEGATVLWATHLTDEIKAEDHIVLLHQARVINSGMAGKISGELTLQDMFLNVTGARVA